MCDINIFTMVILNIQPRNTKKTLRFLCTTIFSRWVFRNFTKAILYVKALQRRWPASRPWSWLVGLPSWHILPANFEVDKGKGVVMVVVVQWIEQTLDFLERVLELQKFQRFFSLFVCLFVCLFESNSVNMSRTGYIYIFTYHIYMYMYMFIYTWHLFVLDVGASTPPKEGRKFNQSKGSFHHPSQIRPYYCIINHRGPP